MDGSESSYYPEFWELAVVFLTSIELVGASVIIKRHWSRENESMPIPVAFAMWAVMMGLYSTMTLVFYTTTAPARILVVLAYCVIFFILLLCYFSVVLRNAIAIQTVDRISPFSGKIEDPSEFAAARKLALRGDIDGAVARYRSYPDNHANALLEAARLLKSEDRFEDAAIIYNEVAEHSYGRRRVWAEALYHLGKLYEVTMNQPDKAVGLYKQILDRSPESRFGQFAGADYTRLLALRGHTGSDSETPAGAPTDTAADPFYRRRGKDAEDAAEPTAVAEPAAQQPPAAEAGPAAEEPAAEDEPEIVPFQDPFYRARMAARAAAMAEGKEKTDDSAAGSKHRKAAAGKTATKTPPPKKPAPKRKPKA